jgi:enamine deaminase RidA (YjgF/YER057c/UK114 family)
LMSIKEPIRKADGLIPLYALDGRALLAYLIKDRNEHAPNRRTRRDALAGSIIMAGALASGLAPAKQQASQEPQGRSTMEIKRTGLTTDLTGGTLPKGIPMISLIAAHGSTIYLTGVTADPNRLGDVKDQTTQILARIDSMLARAGTDKSKLLTALVWLTDMKLFEEHNEAWNAWVDVKNPPVRACLHSPTLWRPGMLVEIMVTAAA